MAKLVVVLSFVSLFLKLNSAEIFSSITQMKGLVRLESALSKSLDRYLKAEPKAPGIIREFADHVREESSVAAVDIDKYLWHPVNCFQLVRRFTRHWRELDLYLSNGDPNDLQWELFVNRPAFPTSQDLMGIITAILRIQDVYNISARVIADGKLCHEKTSAGLEADECYEVGLASNRLEYYEEVIEWMREALKRMSPPYEYNGSVSIIDVLEYLSWAEYQVGQIDDAIMHTKDILQKDPDREQANSNLGHFELALMNSFKESDPLTKKTANNKNKNKEDYMFTYERLCRGETRKSRQERDKLTCHYNKNLPSLLLKPIKVEMLNLDPDLFLLRGVISDSEVEHVTSLAKPLLQRAVVTNTTSGDQIPTQYRVSQSAWLEDSISPVIKRISQRIQTITGLSLEPEHAEPLQIANYGIGGHYEPHHDYIQTPDGTLPAGETGDRVATMLFYLSDVDAGGATVFLNMDEVVFPRKGDAVFWYNLDKSGRPDTRTRHAACPVIVGSKWVANKWINERGQEFFRPCQLYEKQTVWQLLKLKPTKEIYSRRGRKNAHMKGTGKFVGQFEINP